MLFFFPTASTDAAVHVLFFFYTFVFLPSSLFCPTEETLSLSLTVLYPDMSWTVQGVCANNNI